MAHKANVLVKKEWQKLETLISTQIGSTFQFESNKTYFISSVGPQIVFCADVSAQPQANEIIGTGLFMGDEAGYVKDSGDLYVSCPYGEATIHVEEGE